MRSGNTDQFDYSSRVDLRRVTPDTRARIEYLGNFGQLDGKRNIESHRVDSFFDYFDSEKVFLRPIFAEYFRDPLQNIAHRGAAGVGAGYTLMNTSKTDWDLSGGPAYSFTRFDSVELGDDRDETSPAAVIGSMFETELTDRIDLSLHYEANFVSRDAGQVTHHSISTLEVELTSRLDLDVSFVWDRIENPQPETSGDVPKKDDFRLTLGLGFEL